jgi:hypothetical protein
MTNDSWRASKQSTVAAKAAKAEKKRVAVFKEYSRVRGVIADAARQP